MQPHSTTRSQNSGRYQYSYTHLPRKPLTLTEVRREYYRALDHEQAVAPLYARLSRERTLSPVMLGYRAATLALKARYAWNPVQKLKYLKQAGPMFERAIEAEPQHVEIRFLRFAMEHYMPAFLGFSTHLAEDRRAIVEGLYHLQLTGQEDPTILSGAAKFVRDSGRCTETERDQLDTVLALLDEHLHAPAANA